MHQNKPEPEVKTLSIRIPFQLYLMMSQFALDGSYPSLNAAVIELTKRGLEKSAGDHETIRGFILQYVPKEKLKELMND